MPSLRNEGPLIVLKPTPSKIVEDIHPPTTTITTTSTDKQPSTILVLEAKSEGLNKIISSSTTNEIKSSSNNSMVYTSNNIITTGTTTGTNVGGEGSINGVEKPKNISLKNGHHIDENGKKVKTGAAEEEKQEQHSIITTTTNGSSKNNSPSNNSKGYHRTHSKYLEPNHLLHDYDEDYYTNESEYNDENVLLSSYDNYYGEEDNLINDTLQNLGCNINTNNYNSTTSPIPQPQSIASLLRSPIIKNLDNLSSPSPFINPSPPSITAASIATNPTSPTTLNTTTTNNSSNPTTIITTTAKSKNVDATSAILYEAEMPKSKKIYKVVLTGGPCGGKTTGQARLCTFFENLGWKVFRVPESATVLLSGGIKFSELSADQAFSFQEDLVKTMMHIESVFFQLAETVDKDVLIICDRGTMDASAFIPREQWEDILERNGWNEVDIRDTRYNHIIHMVSAANGAEPFYTIEDHATRTEGLELACKLDQKAAQAWVGHPYFDVVDNSTDFETKVCRMIQCVCQKLGIDARDRLQTNSRKVKFLVKPPLPPNDTFPPGYQDFHVVHDYLQTTVPHPKMQARLRKRGQNGNWSYTYTVRRPELQGQVVEVKTALTQRDYNNMLTQKDHNHVTIYKHRRCFLLNDQYFQLDIYDDPCHPRCKGLILLETYSTLNGIELQQRLPECLTIIREVTGDPRYSMFNLSLKDKWENNKNFCLSLAGSVTEGKDGEAQSNNDSEPAGP